MAAALDAYDTAAREQRLAKCVARTTNRQKRVLHRLTDIGGDPTAGVQRFKDALSAIGHDEFLSGRARPREGQQAFKLDLERLLSTGSKLGDVLARLIDLHAEHGPYRRPSARAAEPVVIPPRRQSDRSPEAMAARAATIERIRLETAGAAA